MLTILMRIAAAYDAMPSGRTGDPAAARAYAAFRTEMLAQYEAIPVRVEVWEGDGQPYAGSLEMFDDIDANGQLYVYAGGDEHPYLSREENVKFRAVHDYYGHYLGRFSFGPKGEFNAWKAHCAMFSAAAIPAVTAETLGQNCWVNYGPHRHLPPNLRPYANQKAALLPEELWKPLLEVTPCSRS